MRKLVTGGAGFIGSNYLREFVPANPNINYLVVDSLTYAGLFSNIEYLMDFPNFDFVQGDITDQKLIPNLMRDGDTVINFAAESHVDRSISSGYEFFHTNVLGTQNLLDAGLNLERIKFIQVSTDEVYGSIENGSWDEKFSLSPNSPYSASKAAADLMCLSYFRTFNMDIRITRCCNNYGPFQFPEKLIPFFLKRLLAGQKVPLYGTGQNIREWIHVKDHIAGIDSVDNLGRPGEVYNLGSGHHLSNIQIARLLLKRLNLGDDMIEFVEDRKGHDQRYSLNFSKAASELNFRPVVGFPGGLEETISWYLDHPAFLSESNEQ